MDYRSLFEKTVVELRTLARERGVRLPAGTNKARMIELLLASDEARPAGQPAPQAAAQLSWPRVLTTRASTMRGGSSPMRSRSAAKADMTCVTGLGLPSSRNRPSSRSTAFQS